MHGKHIYIGADNLITLDGLRRADTLDFLNAATVNWSLHNSEADAIADADVLAFGVVSYVAASEGVYQGTIESAVTATLERNTPYWLRLEINEGTADDLRILRRVAKYHDESP